MMANAARTLAGHFERQRGHLLLWWPVFLGTGIGCYFLLSDEPGTGTLAGLGLVLVTSLFLGRMHLAAARFGAALLGFAALGILLATLRSALVAAPVLEGGFRGGVEGRVIGLDRSKSDAPRVLLDEVVLFGRPPAATPERVRITLQGWVQPGILVAGARIVVAAQLSPPSPPAEPGAFDFRRTAWFQHLGAVGYSRSPALLAAPPEHGLRLAFFALRQDMAGRITEELPGPRGAFAAAITTGDMAGLDAATLDSLRASSLAHLYSISGLHLSLLAGFVFAFVRSFVALVPRLALRFNSRKAAALLSILASAFYLVLSGSNVATQRSFIMIAVMLGAVLIDRKALSMRSVAVSALIVLALYPESLTGPGFQMSYAATIALIAGFEALTGHAGWMALKRSRWHWTVPVLTLVLSSALAGFATAPIAAFHFNRISQFGMLANVLAVPMMGLIVMPFAVIAALAAPLGLEGPALQVMGWGIGWILLVSDQVAALGGSVRLVKAGPPETLGIAALGCFFILLWQGRARIAGLAPLTLALMLWISYPRPDLLIAADGKLVGLTTPAGRALSRERGNGFSAQSWLENDGDPVSQAEAALRPGLSHDLPGGRKLVLGGADGAACSPGTVVLDPAGDGPKGNCLLIGAAHLARHGATGIWFLPGGGMVWKGAVTGAGNRPWTNPQ